MTGITMQPLEAPALRVLSFGAGVQSSALLMMAMHREIGPMPDAVIFADTGFEPRQVYEHLDWCEAEVARLTNGQVAFHRVSAGNIRDDHLAGLNTTGQRFASMPLYTRGGDGAGRRQCTKEYKIEPITKQVRALLGVGRGKRVPRGVVVEQWMGISTDEIQRVKASRDKWCVHRYPLIEAGMNRGDCRAWWGRRYPEKPLVKSACIACPFHNNAAWRDMKRNDPESFGAAVEFDEAIRDQGSTLKGMREQQYVHRSGVPLAEADLGDDQTGEMFDVCDEGFCGV